MERQYKLIHAARTTRIAGRLIREIMGQFDILACCTTTYVGALSRNSGIRTKVQTEPCASGEIAVRRSVRP